MASPLVILVSSAVGAGTLGSLFIIVALAVDSWEYISFQNAALEQFTAGNASSGQEYYAVLASSDSSYATLIKTDIMNDQKKNYYLYSSYTGVWRICDNLSGAERQKLQNEKQMDVKKCYTFVTEYDDEDTNLPDMMKSIGRMQNSAASCFIVSLIDVAAAAAVGTFAIVQKQVSACMVTGVLYCMAGLFSIFGLTIFHTKMYYEKYQCYSFDLDRLPSAACDARVVDIGWAIPLTWVGVVICVFAFGLWIFVTRAFRVIKAKTMI